jgi:hypothetical protein
LPGDDGGEWLAKVSPWEPFTAKGGTEESWALS